VPGLTLLIATPYFDPVIRLFLAVLCALGLAFAPVTAIAATATMNGTAGCTMDRHLPAKPSDHSKMDCCTPACQMAAPAALLPERASISDALPHDRGLVASAPAKELASVASSSLDPPPRSFPS
jgi:hypothetical protein